MENSTPVLYLSGGFMPKVCLHTKTSAPVTETQQCSCHRQQYFCKPPVPGQEHQGFTYQVTAAKLARCSCMISVMEHLNLRL